MDRSLLRRMVKGHEDAARVARDLLVDADVVPADSVAVALELWDLRPELFDAPPDAIRVRTDQEARASWARLRARFGR